MIIAEFEASAKNITKVWGFNASRYDYLMNKMGIAPYEAFYGTGNAHVFSFQNLLQFGVAHNASRMGLSPKTVRTLLTVLNDVEEKLEPPFNIYYSERPVSYTHLRAHET